MSTLNGLSLAQERLPTNRGLPPQAAPAAASAADTRRLARGALISGLMKCSGAPMQRPAIESGRLRVANAKEEPGIYKIRLNILGFLTERDVLKATTDLPEDSEHINDFLEHSTFKPDPRIKILNRAVWEKCFGREYLRGLTFPQEPSMKTLDSMRTCAHLLRIPVEKNAGFTILTLPKELTLNQLIALAERPQPGHQPALIEHIGASTGGQHGSKPIPGGVMAISSGLVNGSRKKSVAEQSALVKRYGCELPSVVVATALLFLTHIHSSTTATAPVYLLGQHPLSYTRCIEEVVRDGGSDYLVLGGFSPAGLYVLRDHVDHESHGVLAKREFCGDWSPEVNPASHQ